MDREYNPHEEIGFRGSDPEVNQKIRDHFLNEGIRESSYLESIAKEAQEIGVDVIADVSRRYSNLGEDPSDSEIRDFFGQIRETGLGVGGYTGFTGSQLKTEFRNIGETIGKYNHAIDSYGTPA